MSIPNGLWVVGGVLAAGAIAIAGLEALDDTVAYDEDLKAEFMAKGVSEEKLAKAEQAYAWTRDHPKSEERPYEFVNNHLIYVGTKNTALAQEAIAKVMCPDAGLFEKSGCTDGFVFEKPMCSEEGKQNDSYELGFVATTAQADMLSVTQVADTVVVVVPGLRSKAARSFALKQYAVSGIYECPAEE